MKYSKALYKIYADINDGYSYGTDQTWNYYDNKPLTYPYFDENIFLTYHGSLGWKHYGSSANPNNLKNLYWIITVIFNTTPEQFLIDYIRNDQSKIEA